MFCRNCGAEIKDDWKICPNCGKEIVRNNENIGQVSQQEKFDTKKSKKKIIIGIIIGIIVVGGAGIVYGVNANKTQNTQPKTTTASKKGKKTKEIKDFSKQDFEDLVGKTKEEIEKAGIPKVEKGEYETSDSSVKVSMKKGKVNFIHIEGDEKTAPTFHEVKLGMSKEEAEEKLKDAYPETMPSAEGLYAMNYEKQEQVTCYCDTDNDQVLEISYQALTEEELKEVKEELAQQFVFPDSANKYLSEDEIRKVDVDKMNIGRNEIYARHGYIFTDEEMKQYFENQQWYRERVTADQFKEDVFNSFEKKNIELIKKVEDEVNGTSDSTNGQETNNSDDTNFIGMEGTYQCGSDDESGLIDVWKEGNDIYFAMGTQENPGILGGVGGGMKGTIKDNRTVTIDYGEGLIFTLVWDDAGSFTITRSTSSGWDVIDEITDNVTYVNAEYYGVS
jgi:hypothetical protein